MKFSDALKVGSQGGKQKGKNESEALISLVEKTWKGKVAELLFWGDTKARRANSI